jgi:hypothetical protein
MDFEAEGLKHNAERLLSKFDLLLCCTCAIFGQEQPAN